MNFLQELWTSVGSLSGGKRKAAADHGQQANAAKRLKPSSPRQPSDIESHMPKKQVVEQPPVSKPLLPPVVAQQQEQLPRMFVPLVQQPEAMKQLERHRMKPAANVFKQFPDKRSSPLARLSAPAARPRSTATQYFAGSTLQRHSNTPVVGWASGTPQQHLLSHSRLHAFGSSSRYKVNHQTANHNHQQLQQREVRASNSNLAASVFGPEIAATPAASTPDIKQRLFQEPAAAAAARSANPYMVNYGSAAAAAAATAAGNSRADVAAAGAAGLNSNDSDLSFTTALGREAPGLGLGVRHSPASAAGTALANGPLPISSSVSHLFAGLPASSIVKAEQHIQRELAEAQELFQKRHGAERMYASTYQTTLRRDINKTLAFTSDYEVNPASRGPMQQLQQQAALMQQQRLEQDAARLQQQRRQLHTSLTSPRQALSPSSQQQHEQQHEHKQQQDQQQQQQGEESSDVICIETDDGDHDAVQSSEQQAIESEAQEDGYEEDGLEEDGLEGLTNEYEIEESEESASEEQEDLQAVAAQQQLQQLHIQQWMGPVSNWQPSAEDYDRFRAATSQVGDLAEILTQHEKSNIELTRAHFGTLAQGEWLNDEIINMYMALLLDRDRAMRSHPELRAPKCHFFNTFFLNKLYKDAVEKQHMPADKAYNYQNVRRWTTPKKLSNAGQASDSVLKLDRIIVPVHEGSHWTAAMVDLANKRFVFFDSFHGHNRAALAALRRWLADEAKDKLREDWDCHTWPELYPSNVPRQTNGCDCGVFAILFCSRLGANMPFDFRQQDLLVNARVRVACELLDCKISLPEQ